MPLEVMLEEFHDRSTSCADASSPRVSEGQRSGGRASLRHFCDRNFFNGSRSAFEKFYRDHATAVSAWR
ncbi:hypothetical protein [Prosthecobacter sp.]|jgi:hypothetical protein|uniref:hypothetical protein n=1 Tax=Prosthecobacter sp. TaxID=1965333 RepID=UPI0037C58F31